ncbi:response regulator transcription factor [Salinispira pacifica]
MQRTDDAWPVVLDFLCDVTREATCRSFLEVLCDRIVELVPSDRGAALIHMREGRPYCVSGPEYFTPKYEELFNCHLNRDVPSWPTTMPNCLGPVEWEIFGDIEYNRDFNRPLFVSSSIAVPLHDPVSGRESVLAIHRSHDSPPYDETDAILLDLLTTVLDPIYALFCRAEPDLPEIETPRARSPVTRLTPRETEIAALLCRRISMHEIARRLAISPRTAESHAQHIYQKFDVNGRAELVKILLKGAKTEADD